MVTARARHVASALKSKYGVLGAVAGRCLAAGWSVELMHPTRYGPIRLLCRGGGLTLAVEVYEGPRVVALDELRILLERARLVKAKPVAVLCRGAKLSDEAYKFCVDNGIKVSHKLCEGLPR